MTLFLFFVLVVFLSFYFCFARFREKKMDRYFYEDRFLSEHDFRNLQQLLSDTVFTTPDIEPNGGYHRYNTIVDSPEIRSLLEKYMPILRSRIGNNRVYLANFPLEYRKYESGSFMLRHKDVCFYRIPQYECVLTLSNTSDSITFMEDHPIASVPNSIMIVRANGIDHEVSKITNGGERRILKFVLTETDDLI